MIQNSVTLPPLSWMVLKVDMCGPFKSNEQQVAPLGSNDSAEHFSMVMVDRGFVFRPHDKMIAPK
jgi:hypothetical protein